MMMPLYNKIFELALQHVEKNHVDIYDNSEVIKKIRFFSIKSINGNVQGEYSCLTQIDKY